MFEDALHAIRDLKKGLDKILEECDEISRVCSLKRAIALEDDSTILDEDGNVIEFENKASVRVAGPKPLDLEPYTLDLDKIDVSREMEIMKGETDES